MNTLDDDFKGKSEINEALFKYVCVVTQTYDIVPSNKKHIGAYIEYQDINELRDGFLNELVDSICEWVYNSSKYNELVEKSLMNGKSQSAACAEVIRKAKMKFRGDKNSDSLLIQGQMGELLLFHFIQKCFEAAPLLRKMKITTSPNHERYGADAIHYKREDSKNIIVLGEAKHIQAITSFQQHFLMQ